MSASTDRELLERAATAFWGSEIDDVCALRWSEEDQSIVFTHSDNQDHNGRDVGLLWNPLENDFDALPLAVKLRISLEMAPGHVYAVHADTSAAQYRDTGSGQTMAQVVREAIVACAAEIGRALQPNHESPANSKPGCTGEDQ